MNKELIKKAMAAKSPEELLALAKENKIEISDEEARGYYEKLHEKGELTDEELDNVSGGGCHSGGHLVVSPFFYCKLWECELCGGKYPSNSDTYFKGTYSWHGCTVTKKLTGYTCSGCKHSTYKRGLLLCNIL